MIQIGLADNIPSIHFGFNTYFEAHSNINVASCALNFELLSKQLLSHPIDVLVLDIELTGFNVVTDLKWIVKHFPHLKILVYSNLKEQIYAANCIKMGAKGYINKSATLEHLEEAILKIQSGELVLSDLAKKVMLNKKKQDTQYFTKLSARESEVLRYLCSGKKNNEISNLLHINDKTTSTYKTRLYKKLGVTNIVELITKSKSLGIV
jgi:DNA-binding NarL/FixJ family response regulator